MTFNREFRYWVAKSSDVNSALTDEERCQLAELMNKVELHRESTGKLPLECVVVESDWPIYEKVWCDVEGMVK